MLGHPIRDESASAHDGRCFAHPLCNPMCVPRIHVIAIVGIDDARIRCIESRLVQRMACLLQQDDVRPLEPQEASALRERQNVRHDEGAPTVTLQFFAESPRTKIRGRGSFRPARKNDDGRPALALLQARTMCLQLRERASSRAPRASKK